MQAPRLFSNEVLSQRRQLRAHGCQVTGMAVHALLEGRLDSPQSVTIACSKEEGIGTIRASSGTGLILLHLGGHPLLREPRGLRLTSSAVDKILY